MTKEVSTPPAHAARTCTQKQLARRFLKVSPSDHSNAIVPGASDTLPGHHDNSTCVSRTLDGAVVEWRRHKPLSFPPWQS